MAENDEQVAEYPYVYLSDIWEVFGYPSYGAARLALHRKSFPVPTYKINKRTVIDREVLHTYFLSKRAEGLRELADQLYERAAELEGEPPLRDQLRGLKRRLQKLLRERREGLWSKPPWED